MRSLLSLALIAAFLSAPAPALGQSKSQKAEKPVKAAATAPLPDPNVPTPPPNFEYTPGGRRDPFVSLLNRGTDERSQANRIRPEGLGGVLVDEVVVRGIVQSQGTWVAMIGAPSGRTYSIRPGDRLMDGSVRGITAQAVVMTQEVHEPLAVKQREVRKFLRGEVK
jgi:Tfp pilus assembly protein PilP